MAPKRTRKFALGVGLFIQRLTRLITQPVFLLITVWGHLTILAGSVGFYFFEHNDNRAIHSFLDAIYWAVATITTVGYGEASPVTPGGKIVGIIMMVLGSIFLWTYMALFVSALVAPEIKVVESEIEDIEADVERIESETQKDLRTSTELVRELKALIQLIQKENKR